MVYVGIKKLIPLDYSEVELTDEDWNKFVAACLGNREFTKSYQLPGDGSVLFTSLSAEEFDKLSNDNNDSHDYAFSHCVKQVLNKDKDIIYTKSDNLEDVQKEFFETFDKSVLLSVLMAKWYRFMQTFQQLIWKAQRPDFLADSPNTGES